MRLLGLIGAVLALRMDVSPGALGRSLPPASLTPLIVSVDTGTLKELAQLAEATGGLPEAVIESCGEWTRERLADILDMLTRNAPPRRQTPLEWYLMNPWCAAKLIEHEIATAEDFYGLFAALPPASECILPEHIGQRDPTGIWRRRAGLPTAFWMGGRAALERVLTIADISSADGGTLLPLLVTYATENIGSVDAVAGSLFLSLHRTFGETPSDGILSFASDGMAAPEDSAGHVRIICNLICQHHPPETALHRAAVWILEQHVTLSIPQTPLPEDLVDEHSPAQLVKLLVLLALRVKDFEHPNHDGLLHEFRQRLHRASDSEYLDLLQATAHRPILSVCGSPPGSTSSRPYGLSPFFTGRLEPIVLQCLSCDERIARFRRWYRNFPDKECTYLYEALSGRFPLNLMWTRRLTCPLPDSISNVATPDRLLQILHAATKGLNNLQFANNVMHLEDGLPFGPFDYVAIIAVSLLKLHYSTDMELSPSLVNRFVSMSADTPEHISVAIREALLWIYPPLQGMVA